MMPEITKQKYRCGSLSGECLVLKNPNLPWLIIRVKNEELLWRLYCQSFLITTYPQHQRVLLEAEDKSVDATSINFPFWPTTPETAITDTLRLNAQFKQETQK